MENKTFKKGEIIFREGELGQVFFRILEGTAGVYLNYGEADQRKLTDMKAGQFIGELGVIESWPRSATVVAEEELRVTEISEENLNAFFAEQPDQILALMKQLGGRIRDLTEEYNEVTTFLKQVENAGAEKKESFMDRIRKYQELSRAQKRYHREYTEEEFLKTKEFGKKTESGTMFKTYSKGDIIFREGDASNYMYAIHRGVIGIYDNYGSADQKLLTKLYPNSFFGEMGLIEQERRSATAVVEEGETDLEIIRKENLESLFKTNPMEVDMILQHLSNRLRRLTQDYEKACEKAAGIV